MTYAEFHNGLRMLFNIDERDLAETIGREAADRYWPTFQKVPHQTFIRMPDHMSEAIFNRFLAEQLDAQLADPQLGVVPDSPI